MSTTTDLEPVTALRELLDGSGEGPTDFGQFFALVERVTAVAERLANANHRRGPPRVTRHQNDADREAVRGAMDDLRASYLGPSDYGQRLVWLSRRSGGVPIRRVKQYLAEFRRERRTLLLADGIRDSLNTEGLTNASCPACEMTGDACIEHAPARRIFAVALPEHTTRRLRPELRRAGANLKPEE